MYVKNAVPLFLKMVRLGLITTNSQSGQVEVGELPLDVRLWLRCQKQAEEELGRHDSRVLPRRMELYKARGGKTRQAVTHRERAYVSGYMRKKHADAFIYFLNQTDNIAYIPMISSDETLRNSQAYIPCTYTRSWRGWRMYSAGPRLTGTELTPYGSSATVLNGNSAFDNFDHKLQRDGLVPVYIMDPVYGREASGRNGLFHVVINCLYQAQNLLTDRSRTW